MVIPVGVYLKKALIDGTNWRFIMALIPLGVALTAGGWALGQWQHEFDVHDIVTGILKAPPRIWYFMFFAGPTLILLAGLVALELRLPVLSRLLYPLALFGMGTLPIYTAHSFVLPALKLLDRVTITEGTSRIILPFALFAVE